jgi:Protein of unknown function (DUF3617)
MRASHRLPALALLAVLAACNRTPHAHTDAGAATVALHAGPEIAGGLWVQRVSDNRGARETRYCLDAAAAGALASFDRQLSGGCSRHEMARAADGSWHFSTSCDMGAWGKVSTEGVMRGDFARRYTVEAQSQTVGAAQAAADGPDRVKADVRRLGDCPAGMKPGDVILPDGAHSRLDDLAGHA